MRLGDDAVQDVEVVSTGSIGLDYALGVEAFPAAGSLKSTVPNLRVRPLWPSHVIAEAQKQGGICAIIDAEHAFDRFMQNASEWMSAISGSRSRTTASRLST